MKFITTSWDDGHPLDIRIAELLEKYNLKGTFYIPQNNIEQKVMPERDIKTLSEKFEIGGHTLNHISLKKAPKQKVIAEVNGCFNWLKEVTGSNPVSFCPPFGDYTKESLGIIYDAGFKVVRTTVLLSPYLKAPLTDTTLQVFEHSKFTFFKHLSKRVKFKSLRLWLKCGYTTETLHLLDHYFNYIEAHGGCLHLWGHSWEIEKFQLWNKLEIIFRHIAGRNEYTYIVNRDLAAYSAHN